jgi:hypothetical protein
MKKIRLPLGRYTAYNNLLNIAEKIHELQNIIQYALMDALETYDNERLRIIQDVVRGDSHCVAKDLNVELITPRTRGQKCRKKQSEKNRT